MFFYNLPGGRCIVWGHSIFDLFIEFNIEMIEYLRNMNAQGTNIVVGGIAAAVVGALARARCLPDGRSQTGGVRST